MMRRTVIVQAAAFVAAGLLAGSGRAGAAVIDFDFSFSYQYQSMSGRLVGMQVDANGNGNNVDPTEVLLYTVPAGVGITASPSNPYVFVPYTFMQNQLTNPSPNSTTQRGVYGFNISNYAIEQNVLDLNMIDQANVVNLPFNFGAFYIGPQGTGGTYGITADGDVDALWPTVNSHISYALVVPEGGASIMAAMAAAGLVMRRRRMA